MDPTAATARTERRGWDRYSPLAGVGAVILWVIGTIIAESGDESRDDNAEATLRWFTEDETQIATGEVIFAFGVLLFIWFLGSLRSALFAREQDGHFTALTYGAGLLAALALLIGAAVLIQPSFIDDGALGAETAQAMALVSDAMFGVAEFTLAVMMAAFGLAVLRTGILPRWLAWASLALALLLLIVPVGWIGVIVGFPLWVLVTSVLLFLRGGRPERMAPTGTVDTSA